MRRASCFSVPSTKRPPRPTTRLCSSCHWAFVFCFTCSISSGDAVSSVWPCLRSSSSSIPSGLPPRMMSVPRPAMLVATVTEPTPPACAMMAASRSCCLAFSTW